MKKACLICAIFVAAGSVFAQVPNEDLWKNKILYIGASGGLGAVMGEDGTALGGSLSPLQLDVQINRYLAVGTALNFYFGPKTRYTALKQTDPDSGIMETCSGMETHVLFPLLVKATWKPGVFSAELGGGIYAAPVTMNTTVERTNDNGYTVSEGYGKKLFSVEKRNPLGFTVSGTFGVKSGPGIIFLNASYLRDFAEISVKFNDINTGSHLWSMLSFSIGYKYGLINFR